MGRWVGGIFGNTVGTDISFAQAKGIFSMSDHQYIKKEGGWLPPDGTSEAQAAESAEQAKAMGGTTDGMYWIKPPGVSDAYQTYCLMDGSTNYTFDSGGWTLAYHIRYTQFSGFAHGSLSETNNVPYYYGTSTSGNGWKFWTGATPSNYGGAAVFNSSHSGRAPGAYIAADKILIMSIDSSHSFSGCGASCWYQRDTSWNSGNKKSLRDIFESAGDNQSGTAGLEKDIVWSTGGRKGIWSAGTLSNPTWNTNRSNQGFTGDPFYQTGNTYGSGTGAGVALSGFNLVLNAETDYQSQASDNRSRITTTMCGNQSAVPGNAYGHTVQQGIGNYHHHSAYGGSGLRINGQASYCDGFQDNIAYGTEIFKNFDNTSLGSGCATGSPDSSHRGFAIFVK